MANDVRDPMCLKALFCSLVSPILEYASVVWCPVSSVWIKRAESVQRRFTRIAIRRLLGQSGASIPLYEIRCRMLGLMTLHDRCAASQALLISGLLRNEIDCNSLLNRIPLYAPARFLRRIDFLQIPSRRTLYGTNDPFFRFLQRFNIVSGVFDFHIPPQSLRPLFLQFFDSLFVSPS